MQEDYIIEAKHIDKSFPGVHALDRVNLHVKRGHVHGVVGENGAGKSTLMNILGGLCKKDSGIIMLEGKEVSFDNELQAREHGIGFVHQEPQVVPTMSIAENICLGKFPTKKFIINKQKIFAEGRKYCDIVGITKSPDTLASTLSMGEKQLLQFAKALYYNSKVIILDEPTSSLTKNETEHIFSIVRKLQVNGVTFIYITHRMDELFEICDEVTVLKDGHLVKSLYIKDIDKKGLVNLMVGHELGLDFPPKSETVGKEILRVENLSKAGLFENISFSVYAGEIVGFGGLVGAGRTELMDAIFGMFSHDSGTIYMNGKEVNISSPEKSIKARIAYVTEDRHSGLILHASILENMTLASLKKYVKVILINDKKRHDDAVEFKEKLLIKAPDLKTAVNNLSGGNRNIYLNQESYVLRIK